MTTDAIAVKQLTLAEPTWDQVPNRVRPENLAHPFRVAILRKDEAGNPHVVTAVKSRAETLETVRRLEAITGDQHFRALLKMCPDCHNYGYTTSETEFCDCPAGQALWEITDAIWSADDLWEYDPLRDGPYDPLLHGTRADLRASISDDIMSPTLYGGNQ